MYLLSPTAWGTTRAPRVVQRTVALGIQWSSILKPEMKPCMPATKQPLPPSPHRRYRTDLWGPLLPPRSCWMPSSKRRDQEEAGSSSASPPARFPVGGRSLSPPPETAARIFWRAASGGWATGQEVWAGRRGGSRYETTTTASLTSCQILLLKYLKYSLRYW